jgi:DNA-binding NtrC family response regulator
MVGRIVQDILARQGYQSAYFQNPQSALRAFADAQPKPRLLITDFVMAPINGIELIEGCRQQNPQLKTILYSGTAQEDIFNRHSVRPDRFLSKPFLPQTLLRAVQEVLAPDRPIEQGSVSK